MANILHFAWSLALLTGFCKASCSGKFTAYRDQNKSVHGSYNYSQYQPFKKIEKELHRIRDENEDVFSKELFSIGRTFENRKLWALSIKRRNKGEKKTIVVDCGAHAREWIAPSTCMYLINKLTSVEEAGEEMTEKYNWIVIPLLNPDGYVYTWQNKATRLWRKNRSFTPLQLKLREEKNDELCIGVDVNRNFDKAWGGVGAPVGSPCFEMFAGDKPFSERESSALATFLEEEKNDTIAYVTLHAYGQSWMTPWGFKKELPKEFNEMKRVAQLSVDAMKKYSGVEYSIGPSHNELYPNSGSSTDWAYSNLPTPYTYLVEMLPDDKATGMRAFMPPPSCMVKNAKDIIQGLKTMSAALKDS